MRSVLYAINSNTQSVAAGGIASVDTVIRRAGNNIDLAGNGIRITGAGFYEVLVSLDFTAAAGAATIQLLQDNVPVRGAVAIRTTAAGTTYTVTIPAVVREYCACNGGSILTVQVNGVAAEILSQSVIVEKL